MTRVSEQPILIVDPSGSSSLLETLSTAFNVTNAASAQAALAGQSGEYVAVLLDATQSVEFDYLVACQTLKSDARFEDVPVVLLVSDAEKLDMMKVYDTGMGDVVSAASSLDELIVRLNKAVFHTVANRQLKSRLKQASDMAFSAMSDTSDLGVNIQFLVHCHDCNNIDELGMLIFRTLAHYQINCSLQIRSGFEVKNLEENGLAKDLEARLLWELKDSGRYVDFGRRCVMNYGSISLLVRSMPEDPKRFGAVKDNVFSLLQGADARVKSIDNGRMLEMERDVLRGMAHSMQSVMKQVDDRYQDVMKKCAMLVEDMAMKVEESILFLDLNESQEKIMSDIMQSGVYAVNRLFNEGMKIDESFRKLVDYLNNSHGVNQHSSPEELKRLLDRL